jgi:hypothetical protein
VPSLGAGSRKLSAASLVATTDFSDNSNLQLTITTYPVITMITRRFLAGEPGKRANAVK